MATPYDPTRFDIPGVAPQQPTPRSPLRRPDSPANFSAPRNAPGTVRGEIPLYPGGDASKPAAITLPRPDRAIAMDRAIASNNERIATQGAAMRAKAQAAQDANTAARLDPGNTRDRAYGVDAVAAGMAQGARVAAPNAAPTATGVGTGDIGLPANVRADVARRSAPAPQAPTPAAAPAPAEDPSVGYFIGSDGRKQTFTRSQAEAKAAELPTQSGLARKGYTPEVLATMGFRDMEDGAVSLNMAPGTNPLDENYRAPVASAPSVAAPAGDAQMARINSITADPERQAGIAAVVAQGRAQNAAATGAPTPPPAGTPAGGTTPTGVTTVASGTAAPRLSPADEFNSIREGLRRPGQYDPTRGISRARSEAFNVTNPMSKERALVDLATRLAADSNLKGRPGARNAIIQSLMGQLDAGNNASLEGLRQRGQAGVSGQEFDQSLFSGEVDRRGARLRDQFLVEGEERLARLNNDAALERTVIGGLLSGQGRGDGRGDGRSGDNKRADDALATAQEQFPDDPVAAAARAQELLVGGGVDPEGTFAGNLNESTIRRPILDYRNDSVFGLGQIIDDWAVGRDTSQRLPEDFDFSSDNVKIDADDSFLLDLEQFFSPRWAQPYTFTTQGANGEEFSQVVRPGWTNSGPDRIPTVDEALRIQRARDTSLARRPAAPAPTDEDRY
jgi:hypothetical protein